MISTAQVEFAPTQKSVYSLAPLRETLSSVNRRHLKFISELTDSCAGIDDVKRLSETVKVGGRGLGSYNLLALGDLKLFHTPARGEKQHCRVLQSNACASSYLQTSCYVELNITGSLTFDEHR